MSEYQIRVLDGSNIWDQMKVVMEMVVKGLAAGPVLIILTRDKRSREQNAKLWPMLEDIRRHMPQWHGNQMGREDYKDMITGSYKKCRVVPNTESTGFVMIGASTSKMGKAQFAGLIEFIYAFGAEHQVPWSERSQEVYAEYAQAA